MTSLLIKNISLLAGIERKGRLMLAGRDMSVFESIENAFLYVEDGVIRDFGNMSLLSDKNYESYATVVDAQGGMVLPSFCDSHTHIVYAGSREHEFIDKIRGLSYAEIARRGGGILNSADRLHELSEDELYRQAMRRIDEVIAQATNLVDKLMLPAARIYDVRMAVAV